MERTIDKLISWLERQAPGWPLDSTDLSLALADARRMRAQLDSAWIPCAERLPEVGQVVLIAYVRPDTMHFGGAQYDVAIATRIAKDSALWMADSSKRVGDVRFWRPLPDPPGKRK